MQSQEWKIVRTKTDDPLNKPVQTMVLFNGEPVGFVQGYSLGQNVGNAFETLILEIACPKVTIEEVTTEELNERLGRTSKYKGGGEDALLTKDDVEFAAEVADTVKGE